MQRIHLQYLCRLQGSSLVISLVFLTIVTLAAVVGMQRSGLQLKMVANLQFQQRLFNAAQDALSHSLAAFKHPDHQENVERYLALLTNSTFQLTQAHSDVKRLEQPSLEAIIGDSLLPTLKVDDKSIVSVKVQGRALEALPVFSRSGQYLKGNLGSSTQAQSTVRFALRAEVTDIMGHKAYQEVGLEYSLRLHSQ